MNRRLEECSVEKLVFAVSTGNVGRVRRLLYGEKHLRSGVIISRPNLPVNIVEGTVFHVAAELGHTDMMCFLCSELQRLQLSSQCLSFRDRTGWTPLTLAIENGHCEVVRILLQFGVDVECRIEPELSVLHGNWERRLSPLVLAIKCLNVPIVKILLNHGADPDTRLRIYGTSLHYAITLINAEEVPEKKTLLSDIVDLLLSFGANPCMLMGDQTHVCSLHERYVKKFMLTDVYFSEVRIQQILYTRHALEPGEFYIARKKEKERIQLSWSDSDDDDGRGTSIAWRKFYTDVQIFKHVGPTAIEAATSSMRCSQLERMKVCGAGLKAALSLSHLLRIILLSDRALCKLLEELIIKISLHVCDAFGCLSLHQVNHIVSFSRKKETLGTAKLKFLRDNVSQFFDENQLILRFG
jgi:hypothetical protein